MLLSMYSSKVSAANIAVENADGVTICYNYINDNTELEVARKNYSGSVVIPDEVTYMNRTRKVTRIGAEAFYYCYGLTSVTIPNSVTSIGAEAFYNCYGLTSVTIPNSVTSIGDGAFQGCYGLTSVTIPNSVTSIGAEAFYNCYGLTSVTIPNSVTSIGAEAFYNCYGLTSVTIPNSVTSIGDYAFQGCSRLTSVTIPNSVTSIGDGAFQECRGLTSVTIPNSVTSIGNGAFSYCISLTSVTIPNSVTSIGGGAFDGVDLPTVVSLIQEPFGISGVTFSKNTFANATLYVPSGTIDKYKATEGWKQFSFIEEGSGPGGEVPVTKKCEKPTISYADGKLTFSCATEGATCQSIISDDDIRSYSVNEVQLGVTYHISVYATCAGYESSETAEATLCWVEASPKSEGLQNSIASMPSHAVLIQGSAGQLSISGAEAGTPISIYDASGRMVGSAKASDGMTHVSTTLSTGDIGIVKLGGKAIKVVMQ